MKSHLFSVVLINLFLKTFSNSILDCSTLKEEMECNFCNDEENYCHCYWNENKCNINQTIYNEKLFISNFNEIYNKQSKSDIKNFCGEIPSFLNKDFIYVPNLLKDNGYGKKGEKVYCKFDIKIENEKSIFKVTKTIDFDIPKIKNSPDIYLKINTMNNFQEFYKITENKHYDKTNFKFFLTLFIILNDEYKEYPFQIKITFYKDELIRLYIALITFLIVLAFIIRTIIVVYLSQTKTRRNIEKIIKKRKYKKNMGNYGTTCSICLEDFFIGGREVSITPCKHMFHFTCIHAWLLNDNNVRHTKCPNCNAPILKEEEKNNFNNNNNRNNNRRGNSNMRNVQIV